MRRRHRRDTRTDCDVVVIPPIFLLSISISRADFKVLSFRFLTILGIVVVIFVVVVVFRAKFGFDSLEETFGGRFGFDLGGRRVFRR